MFDKNEIRALSVRIAGARADLLNMTPFFGRLILRLPVGYADCGTAFTDMQRIVFDPEFAKQLGDKELAFVLLHEILHCVLHHCTRGRGLMQYTFNVACDIVVNSLALQILGIGELEVAGESVMHLAPNGQEGRELTAEAVYDMLTDHDRQQDKSGSGGKAGSDADGRSSSDTLPKDGYGKIDSHDAWGSVDASACDDLWDSHVKEALNAFGAGSLPGEIKRTLVNILRPAKVEWKQLLHDFIKNNRGDYSFIRPDRRFQGDILMPSFIENSTGESVEGLWVLIDTSASISDDQLAAAYSEIIAAADQLDGIEGMLSFFDAAVSTPQPFASREDIAKMEPIGGGGTSFRAIFEYMEAYFEHELPKAVIIITDGQATYPKEEAALGVPVMWVIMNSHEDPPWGVVVHAE